MSHVTANVIQCAWLDYVDTLVFHLQFFHDGHLFGWPGEHDTHENTSQGLRSVQQRR